MIELPEAVNLSKQLICVFNKKIIDVIAADSPNKFAWYTGDPKLYRSKLNNKKITSARAVGGMVEIKASDILVVLSDGVSIKYIEDAKAIPKKHQLLITLEDNTYLCASIQMYGGILCSKENKLDNSYYLTAKKKPSPLSKEYNKDYFFRIINNPDYQKLSIKALLATDQRIPGLGNGVLQDILFNARLHPKTKLQSFSKDEKNIIFNSIKATLNDMVKKGGRDTEKDLFGKYGNYITKLSRNTVGKPCTECKTPIKKESYMGGSIYFCPVCQNL